MLKRIAFFMLTFFLFLEEGTAQKRIIAMDEELKNNSQHWLVKRKENRNYKKTRGKKKIALYQFGPFTVTQPENIDTAKIKFKRSFSDYLPHLFRNDKNKYYTALYQIFVSKGKDTADIVFCRWVHNWTSTAGMLSVLDKEDYDETYIDSITAIIKINGDPESWLLVTGQAPFSILTFNPINATLQKGDISWSIENIDRFEGNNRTIAHSAGAALKNQEKESLAALQTRPKMQVWMKKGLTAEEQVFAAGCMILLLCNMEF